MEKPTIYASAPKPPKQIRVDETSEATNVEKQELPETKQEQPSKITVMHPTVPKDTVVKLNTEKSAATNSSDEDKTETLENEKNQTEELKETSPLADVETATDFFDGKEIVSIYEPAEVTNVSEAAQTTNTFEEKEEAEIDEAEAVKESPESAIISTENEGTTPAEDLQSGDVDTQEAAESTIEKEQIEKNTVDEMPQEITKDDEKQNDEKVVLVTDEDLAATLPQNIEQDSTIEFENQSIADVEENVEQSSASSNLESTLAPEEIEPLEERPVGTKPTEKNTKSSAKSKLDPENEFENLKIPGDDELFQRQYYTMGEVATMFHANQSQIRFWENEFDILQPKKNKKGDRYFRPEDVKNLQVIHHLLRNRRFTIEGAREYLKSNKQRTQDTVSAIASLGQLKSFLTELKANL